MKTDGKIRPLPEERLYYTDGYRGDGTIAWTLVASKVPGRRSTEMFGTWCVHCRTSWGWAVTAGQANKLHRAMAKLGCPRCPSSSTKAKKV